MKILKFSDVEAWMAARRGKITGSRLGDIYSARAGSKKKIGYYELIAERLATEPEGGETPMDRGTRLEPVALELYAKTIGKKIDPSLVIWAREDNDSIAISPDGILGKSEAVEVKCLSSARHIEALLTRQIPSEYEYQMYQYFIVNDGLKKLHFVFYDPRIPAKPLFAIIVKREDIKEEIAELIEFERMTLAEIDEIVLKLSNF